MKHFRTLGIASFCYCASIVAVAQEIVIDPQVTGEIDEVDILSPIVEPIETNLSRYWSQSVARQSAEFIRLRFSIVSSQAAGDALLRISTSSQPNAYSLTIEPGTAAGDSFWTPPIFARQLEIAMLANEPPVGLQVRLDRVAYTTQPGRMSSIVGLDQRQDIALYDDQPVVFQRQSAVAKLTFAKEGKLYVCTGFLVAESLLLTNEHCINSAAICPSLSATFGYQAAADGRRDPGVSYPCTALVEFDYETDYALVQLANNPGRSWGAISLQRSDVSAGNELFVIQHPAGEPKQISWIDCSTTDPSARGRGPNTDFAHTCDTLGGSSGSPVFSRNGALVGLHHYGIGGIHWNENRAVKMSRVIAASATLQALLAGP